MPNQNPSPREIFRAALERTAGCPSAEALERALNGADPATAAHVQSCLYCRAEAELLRSFQAADVPAEDAAAVRAIAARLQSPVAAPAPRAPGQSRSWWLFGGSWLRPAALAAAGLMAVIAIGLQFRHSGPPALGTATGSGSGILRAHTVAVLAPVGDLRKSPDEVRWEAVPSAASYRVRLLEVDGHELWSAPAVAAAIAFPPAVRALIVPARTLSIFVTAFDAQGQKIAESERVQFRILQNVYPQ